MVRGNEDVGRIFSKDSTVPQTRMRFFRINTVSITKLLVENIIWKWMMMNGREERIHSNSQTLEPVVPLEGNRDSKVNIILVQI